MLLLLLQQLLHPGFIADGMLRLFADDPWPPTGVSSGITGVATGAAARPSRR